MKVIRSLAELDHKLLGSATFCVTIGNFDGVHCGHVHLLEQVLSYCKKEDKKFVVITFVPHPREIIHPDSTPFLINTYEERRELLAQQGVDFLLELEFGRDFSTQSPQNFLDNYLLVNNRLTDIFLGYDFSFGSDKSGNYEFAKDYCSSRNIDVHLLQEHKGDEKNISSSVIRRFLTEGNVDKASELLGRPFYLSGLVVKGEGRGRQIGFPTANLELKRRLIPSTGVYITRSTYSGMTYNSVTNIGFRPTFEGEKELSVETYILDFDMFVYGEHLKVEFLKKLRDEIKFSSVNDLLLQIDKDVQFTREYFSSNQ